MQVFVSWLHLFYAKYMLQATNMVFQKKLIHKVEKNHKPNEFGGLIY